MLLRTGPLFLQCLVYLDFLDLCQDSLLLRFGFHMPSGDSCVEGLVPADGTTGR